MVIGGEPASASKRRDRTKASEPLAPISSVAKGKEYLARHRPGYTTARPREPHREILRGARSHYAASRWAGAGGSVGKGAAASVSSAFTQFASSATKSRSASNSLM